LARQLGATEVTDYRTGPPKGPFDVILDVMGSLGWKDAKPLLSPNGRLVLITATLADMLASSVNRRFLTGTNKDDLPSMRRLVELHQKGGYTPVVGQVLPFAQLAEAHRIAESFHKPGNLVVTME
jgi:NADPH:quinone reductase-like Zn-dependent oxidoreductase